MPPAASPLRTQGVPGCSNLLWLACMFNVLDSIEAECLHFIASLKGNTYTDTSRFSSRLKYYLSGKS
jgi:hypothetical protein